MDTYTLEVTDLNKNMSCCTPVMKDCSICGKSTQIPNTLQCNCQCCFHVHCFKKLENCPNCMNPFKTESKQLEASHSTILKAYVYAILETTYVYVGPYNHIITTLLKRNEGGERRFPSFKNDDTNSQSIDSLVNCVGWEIFECYQKSKWTWEMVVAFVVSMLRFCDKDRDKISNMVDSLKKFLVYKLGLKDWSSFHIRPNFIHYMEHEYLIYEELKDYTTNPSLSNVNSTIYHYILDFPNEEEKNSESESEEDSEMSSE